MLKQECYPWEFPYKQLPLSDLPDEILVKNIKVDEVMFSEFFRRYWGVGFAYCHRILNRPYLAMIPEMAEEAAQDGFFVFHRVALNGGIRLPFKPFMLKIMSQRAIEGMRKELGRSKNGFNKWEIRNTESLDREINDDGVLLMDVIQDKDCDIEKEFEAKELRENIEEASFKIGQAGEAFRMRYFDDLTLNQIGQILRPKVTREAVRQLIEKAKPRIRDILRERGYSAEIAA